MRVQTSRIVIILLGNLLILPTVLSLFFSLLENLLSLVGLNGAAFFLGLQRVRLDSHQNRFWVEILRKIERWILGTRKPRLENLNK